MNKYPAKAMMDEMATHGRYGDTMLVHMNLLKWQAWPRYRPPERLPPRNRSARSLFALVSACSGHFGWCPEARHPWNRSAHGIRYGGSYGDLKRGLISGLTAGAAGALPTCLLEAHRPGLRPRQQVLMRQVLPPRQDCNQPPHFPKALMCGCRNHSSDITITSGFDPASAFTDLRSFAGGTSGI